MEPKPHMVILYVDDGVLTLRAECPYADLGSDRPCAVMDENPEAPPAPPAVGPPTWISGMPYRDGEPVGPSDPWASYERELDLRPDHVPTDDCWVEHWLKNADVGPDEIVKCRLEFRVPMDWTNIGGYDDACLELTPWPEPLPAPPPASPPTSSDA